MPQVRQGKRASDTASSPLRPSAHSPDSALAGEGRHAHEDEDEDEEQHEDGVEQEQDEAALGEAVVLQGLLNDLLLCRGAEGDGGAGRSW